MARTQDAVRFLLLSSEDGSTWTEVGASAWQYQTDGSLLLHPDLRWPVSLPRNHEEIVVITVPEHWRLMSVGTYAVAAPMFLVGLPATTFDVREQKQCWQCGIMLSERRVLTARTTGRDCGLRASGGRCVFRTTSTGCDGRSRC
eukprot:58953-Rhodomonas_salina.1